METYQSWLQLVVFHVGSVLPTDVRIPVIKASAYIIISPVFPIQISVVLAEQVTSARFVVEAACGPGARWITDYELLPCAVCITRVLRTSIVSSQR